MDFRMATAADRQAVETMWDYCFEHRDEPFFTYYFGQYWEPENTVVGYDGDDPVSMVHLRQYTIDVRGKAIPMSYLVGVATAPEARRGGVGGQLLAYTIEELHKRQQPLTILMPSKAAFYQQYGFDLYAHQWLTELPLDALRPMTDRSLHFEMINDPKDWRKLAPVYEAYTKDLTGYAIRGEADWVRMLGDMLAEGNRIAAVKTEDGHIEGYCMYKLGEPRITVPEMIYATRRGQKGLLNFLYNHRSQGDSVQFPDAIRDTGYVFYPDGRSGHSTVPYMMNRIVDVVDAFESVPVVPTGKEEMLTMAVRDPLVARNHGIFKIHISPDGVVHAEKMSTAVPEKGERAIVDVTFDVGALGIMFMGRLTASECVFNDKAGGNEGVIALLDAVYPKKETFINEWW